MAKAPLQRLPLDRYVDELYGRLVRLSQRAKNFLTAGRVPNWITSRTRGVLHIIGSRAGHNTSAGSSPGFDLELREVRVALDLLVRKGRIDRKGLEKAGRHSSALMGLILTFLADLVSLVTLFTRRFLIRLRWPRIHVGGLEREGEALYRAVAEAGGGYLLLSYYYLRQHRRGRDGGPPAWKRHAVDYGMEVLRDCGIFSFTQEVRRASRKGLALPHPDLDQLCDDYCEWLLEEQAEPFTYMALDVMGDPHESRRLLLRMLQRGLRPIPVFHYVPGWRQGEGWDALYWLWRQGFDVIALGNSVGVPEAERREWASEAMRRVPADRQNYHGLGFGSMTVALLPFYSTDATTYKVGRDLRSLRGGRGSKVLTDFGQRPSTVPATSAVRLNLRWQIGLGARCSRTGGGVQGRLDEMLDGCLPRA